MAGSSAVRVAGPVSDCTEALPEDLHIETVIFRIIHLHWSRHSWSFINGMPCTEMKQLAVTCNHVSTSICLVVGLPTMKSTKTSLEFISATLLMVLSGMQPARKSAGSTNTFFLVKPNEAA
jgi:hypothetical protein